ncbi:MAG: hypothetical protein ACYTEQ_21095 [Planctomycetota bacterium]|jgi:hypothetical protein
MLQKTVSFIGALSTIQKIKSLLNSRRMWVFAFTAVLAGVAFVGQIVPAMDVDLDVIQAMLDDGAPTELAEQAISHEYTRQVIALLEFGLFVLGMFGGGVKMASDYTKRPPGVGDWGEWSQ